MMQEIIVLTGPTASGKTSIAVEIAQNIKNSIIINGDASQVYIDTPIISAQPTKNEKGEIPHLMYGYIDGNIRYSIAMWLKDIHKIVENEVNLGNKPIIVGGSGMYINALFNGISEIPDVGEEIRQEFQEILDNKGIEILYKLLCDYDPEGARNLNMLDKQRVFRAVTVFVSTGKSIKYWQKNAKYHPFKNYNFKKYLKIMDREILYNRINRRFDDMVRNDVFKEVEKLMNRKLDETLPIMKTHGVPEIINIIKGNSSEKEMFDKAKQNIRNYAKRQFTWFRNQYNNYEEI